MYHTLLSTSAQPLQRHRKGAWPNCCQPASVNALAGTSSEARGLMVPPQLVHLRFGLLTGPRATSWHPAVAKASWGWSAESTCSSSKERSTDCNWTFIGRANGGICRLSTSKQNKRIHTEPHLTNNTTTSLAIVLRATIWVTSRWLGKLGCGRSSTCHCRGIWLVGTHCSLACPWCALE